MTEARSEHPPAEEAARLAKRILELHADNSGDARDEMWDLVSQHIFEILPALLSEITRREKMEEALRQTLGHAETYYTYLTSDDTRSIVWKAILDARSSLESP